MYVDLNPDEEVQKLTRGGRAPAGRSKSTTTTRTSTQPAKSGPSAGKRKTANPRPFQGKTPNKPAATPSASASASSSKQPTQAKNSDFESKHPRAHGKFAPKGTVPEAKPGASPNPKPMNPHDRKAAITQVSKDVLRVLGYKGDLQSAIKQFQKDSGLPPNGIATKATLAAMRDKIKGVRAKRQGTQVASTKPPQGEPKLKPPKKKKPEAKAGLTTAKPKKQGKYTATKKSEGVTTSGDFGGNAAPLKTEQAKKKKKGYKHVVQKEDDLLSRIERLMPAEPTGAIANLLKGSTSKRCTCGTKSSDHAKACPVNGYGRVNKEEAEDVEKFNPAQPRAKDGKWTKGGGVFHNLLSHLPPEVRSDSPSQRRTRIDAAALAQENRGLKTHPVQTDVDTSKMTARHYEVLARAIHESTPVGGQERDNAAQHIAANLGNGAHNPNFKNDQFLRTASGELGGREVKGKFTRRDFEATADLVGTLHGVTSDTTMRAIANNLADKFQSGNPNFKRDKFIERTENTPQAKHERQQMFQGFGWNSSLRNHPVQSGQDHYPSDSSDQAYTDRNAVLGNRYLKAGQYATYTGHGIGPSAAYRGIKPGSRVKIQGQTSSGRTRVVDPKTGEWLGDLPGNQLKENMNQHPALTSSKPSAFSNRALFTGGPGVHPQDLGGNKKLNDAGKRADALDSMGGAKLDRSESDTGPRGKPEIPDSPYNSAKEVKAGGYTDIDTGKRVGSRKVTVRASKKEFIYTGQALLDKGNPFSPGRRVRLVKLPGVPGPGTMGQFHVVDAETGEFLGMVSYGSLAPIGKAPVPGKAKAPVAPRAKAPVAGRNKVI